MIHITLTAVKSTRRSKITTERAISHGNKMVMVNTNVTTKIVSRRNWNDNIRRNRMALGWIYLRITWGCWSICRRNLWRSRRTGTLLLFYRQVIFLAWIEVCNDFMLNIIATSINISIWNIFRNSVIDIPQKFLSLCLHREKRDQCLLLEVTDL